MHQRYLIQFFLLTILFSNSTTLSMEKEDDSTRTMASTPFNAPKNAAYDRDELISQLIKKVEILQAHENDYIDYFRKLITPEVIRSIEKNVEGNEKILSLLTDLKNKKLTEDKVLNELLFLRFSLIISRQKNTSIFMTSRSGKIRENVEFVYGPTHPDIYESLNEDQKILAVKAIDKYQTFNRVIIGLTQMVDVRRLSSVTKQLLRASPTLCSILEGQSEDLGHPDETFIMGNNDEGRMSDWEYFTTHIQKSETVLAYSYSTFYKSKQPIMIQVTPYEKKQDDPNWQHKFASFELPYPNFLKPYPLPSVIQSAPTPNAIFPTEETENAEKEESVESAIATVHKPELEVAFSSSVSSSQASPISLPIEEDTKNPENDEPTVIDTPLKQENMPNLKTTFTHPQKTGAIFSKDVKKKEPKTDKILAPRRPRGAIHYDALPPQNLPVDLKGKHRKTLESLFHIQGFRNVDYGEFASLWKHINGPHSIKGSSGGSHKELLDHNNKVISGIFAHRDSQTFGDRSIKYIRDALNQIGYQG